MKKPTYNSILTISTYLVITILLSTIAILLSLFFDIANKSQVFGLAALWIFGFGFLCWAMYNISPEEMERYSLLRTLEKVSHKYPDLRLGQIISNATPEGEDPFYATDEELNKALKEYLEE